MTRIDEIRERAEKAMTGGYNYEIFKGRAYEDVEYLLARIKELEGKLEEAEGHE